MICIAFLLCFYIFTEITGVTRHGGRSCSILSFGSIHLAHHVLYTFAFIIGGLSIVIPGRAGQPAVLYYKEVKIIGRLSLGALHTHHQGTIGYSASPTVSYCQIAILVWSTAMV